MTSERIRSICRGTLTLLLAAAIYETLARSGWFAPALMPTLEKIAGTLVAVLADGSMLAHAATTLYRVLFGFSLAILAGLPLGILMGRSRAVENFVLPLASALMPTVRGKAGTKEAKAAARSDTGMRRAEIRHVSDLLPLFQGAADTREKQARGQARGPAKAGNLSITSL